MSPDATASRNTIIIIIITVVTVIIKVGGGAMQGHRQRGAELSATHFSGIKT